MTTHMLRPGMDLWCPEESAPDALKATNDVTVVDCLACLRALEAQVNARIDRVVRSNYIRTATAQQEEQTV